MFYERTALSRNKVAMLTKGARPRAEDAVTPEEEIKDPLVLEFLGLKDEYSEAEIEEALIVHLEQFLLELGRHLGSGPTSRNTLSRARAGRVRTRTRRFRRTRTQARTGPLTANRRNPYPASPEAAEPIRIPSLAWASSPGS